MQVVGILKAVPGYLLASIRLALIVIAMFLFVFFYGIIVLTGGHKPKRAFLMRRSFVVLSHWILGIRTEVLTPVTNLDVPSLYVCNHRSLIDPVIISRYINTVILSKAEVKDYPLIGIGAQWSGVIYVERDQKDSRTAARIAMEKALEDGFDVLVYPEGTVGGQPGTLPFRPGSFETAWQIKAPVIPIALSYRDPMADFWTDGGLMKQYFKKFGKWKTEARVAFGPVLTDGEDGKLLAKKAQDWIDAQIREMDKGWITSRYPWPEGYLPPMLRGLDRQENNGSTAS